MDPYCHFGTPVVLIRNSRVCKALGWDRELLAATRFGGESTTRPVVSHTFPDQFIPASAGGRRDAISHLHPGGGDACLLFLLSSSLSPTPRHPPPPPPPPPLPASACSSCCSQLANVLCVFIVASWHAWEDSSSNKRVPPASWSVASMRNTVIQHHGPSKLHPRPLNRQCTCAVQQGSPVGSPSPHRSAGALRAGSHAASDEAMGLPWCVVNLLLHSAICMPQSIFQLSSVTPWLSMTHLTHSPY